MVLSISTLKWQPSKFKQQPWLTSIELILTSLGNSPTPLEQSFKDQIWASIRILSVFLSLDLREVTYIKLKLMWLMDRWRATSKLHMILSHKCHLSFLSSLLKVSLIKLCLHSLLHLKTLSMDYINMSSDILIPLTKLVRYLYTKKAQIDIREHNYLCLKDKIIWPATHKSCCLVVSRRPISRTSQCPTHLWP